MPELKFSGVLDAIDSVFAWGVHIDGLESAQTISTSHQLSVSGDMLKAASEPAMVTVSTQGVPISLFSRGEQ